MGPMSARTTTRTTSPTPPMRRKRRIRRGLRARRERVDGLVAGRLDRGIDAVGGTQDARNQEREQQAPEADRELEGKGRAQSDDSEHADPDAQDPADQREDHRLAEELQEDLLVGGADGLAEA